MIYYDIFNGDADGLCSLQQMRLHQPRYAELITGVKRDTQLLKHLDFKNGDSLDIFDIGIDQNLDELSRALKMGAVVRWFDHHATQFGSKHPRLEMYLDFRPQVCTSLIVNSYLLGKYAKWALVGCYGDSLDQAGDSLAQTIGISAIERNNLRKLGIILNYNSYGEKLSDLHISPSDLYHILSEYNEPIDFFNRENIVKEIEYIMQADLTRGLCQTIQSKGNTQWVVLSDKKWARRISGLLANELMKKRPHCVNMVILEKENGFLVSLRRPVGHRFPISQIANKYASGGGRAEAAGINLLGKSQLISLINDLNKAYNN